MKYLIRALKAFLHFTLLITAIFLILIVIKAIPADIDEMFRDGARSIWQVALMVGVISAIYPKVEYMEKTFTPTDASKAHLQEVLQGRGYVLEKDGGKEITFRKARISDRIRRKGEDRITFRLDDGNFTAEGLRKDILLITQSI